MWCRKPFAFSLIKLRKISKERKTIFFFIIRKPPLFLRADLPLREKGKNQTLTLARTHACLDVGQNIFAAATLTRPSPIDSAPTPNSISHPQTERSRRGFIERRGVDIYRRMSATRCERSHIRASITRRCFLCR